jgi:phosphoribosylamine--glycine ligase
VKVAVIGSGGREHALAWSLTRHAHGPEVFVIPGNGGTGNNVLLDVMDFPALEHFCSEQGVELLVVGPEAPLAAGLADHFQGSRVKVFGPGKDAARLESSKVWAKRFMQRHGVATAAFETFESLDAARGMIAEHQGDVVIKYDGLAGGKGVFVCRTPAEAEAALAAIAQRWGASAPVVVEERLEGNEISILGFTDGKSIRLLPPSQDHKQLLDGDEGPNTGGMGAFCPVPQFGPELLARVEESVIAPTLRGLQEEGIPYVGVLYFGLMITPQGPRLLEYNVRLGDPEAEVVLPAFAGNLLDLILACLDGTLERFEMCFHPGYFVDVVLTSAGYPGEYGKGYPIRGLDSLPGDVLVFHAGTRWDGDELVTAGGRVLNVVARGAELETAIERAYAACAEIEFQGKTHRSDIGRRPWPPVGNG